MAPHLTLFLFTFDFFFQLQLHTVVNIRSYLLSGVRFAGGRFALQYSKSTFFVTNLCQLLNLFVKSISFYRSTKEGRIYSKTHLVIVVNVHTNVGPFSPLAHASSHTIFHQDELKNRLICTLFFNSSWC